jgi:hypothetical protein
MSVRGFQSRGKIERQAAKTPRAESPRKKKDHLSVAFLGVFHLGALATWRSFIFFVLCAPSLALAAATTQSLGPKIVVLDELSKLYKPVPFNHQDHAAMAMMWDGCKTCHHRDPVVNTSIVIPFHLVPNQVFSSVIPKCDSCHAASVTTEDIHMPSLKGALHRQCLNCHREWMHENACVVCHAPINPDSAVLDAAPSVDDIIGRIHPPVDPPDVKTYRPRFTPAVGNNVIFRHGEHTKTFGLKCVSCHHHDDCSNCHDGAGTEKTQDVMKPGATWHDSHEPCVGCHAQDRCETCHYPDNQSPPKPFAHDATGQALDKDHAKLKCDQCHIDSKKSPALTCGDASCHKPTELIAFPARRPGLYAVPQPTTKPLTLTVTGPATKPVILRIRNGGS